MNYEFQAKWPETWDISRMIKPRFKLIVSYSVPANIYNDLHFVFCGSELQQHLKVISIDFFLREKEEQLGFFQT